MVPEAPLQLVRVCLGVHCSFLVTKRGLQGQNGINKLPGTKAWLIVERREPVEWHPKQLPVSELPQGGGGEAGRRQ